MIAKYAMSCTWNLRPMMLTFVIRSLGLEMFYIHCSEIENILQKVCYIGRTQEQPISLFAL